MSGSAKSTFGDTVMSGSAKGTVGDTVMSGFAKGTFGDAVMSGSAKGTFGDTVMSGSAKGTFGDVGMSGSGPIFQYNVVKGDGISILTITAPELDLHTVREVFFRIDTDVSGSMGGDKLKYVKACLCKLVNMLLGYKETYPLFTFYVSIVAFDTRLITISPIVTINGDTVALLIKQINMMREDGGTAFDNPFIDAQKQIGEFKVDHPDATILRLFLSDGEVNQGIKDKVVLYKMLHEPEVDVGVVGLCDGHDVETMITLANSSTSTYIYIAEPETFGPLISDFLSKMFVVTTDVTIHCDRNGDGDGGNGDGSDQRLYNFRTGWNPSLKIPVLTSVQKRSFYVQGNSRPLTISFTHNGITETVIVNPVSCERDIQFEVALLRLGCIVLMTKTLLHIDEQYKVHMDQTAYYGMDGYDDCCGMNRYRYRDGPDDCYRPDDCCGMNRDCDGLDTPEALTVPDTPEAPTVPDTPEAPKTPSLEQDLRDTLQKLVEFIKENNLQEDTLMNQLCKDLEICLKALFAPHNIAKAFVSARLLAQAEQKCVTISDTRVLDNLTQRHVSGLYDDNFTPFSRTCTADSTPSCGDIMRSMS